MTKERTQIPDEYKWSIDEIYDTQEEWKKEIEKSKELVEKIKNKKGNVTNTSDSLLQVLKLKEKLERKTSKFTAYPRMKHHEDMRKDKYKEMNSKAQSIRTEINTEKSFIIPEILETDETKIKQYIEENEELKHYEKYLKEILRLKKHTKSEEIEEILSDLSEVLASPHESYSIMMNADMEFPSVKTSKGEKQITLNNYTSLLKNKNKKFRKEVHKKFYNKITELENTIATNLENNVKENVQTAKIRNYNSALEASLKPSHIDTEVYETLIDTINENLEILHKHIEFKKEINNLEQMEMCDIYLPATKGEDPEISFEEAKEHVIKAVAPLGEEYQNKMRKGLENEKWVDVYENKGKRSGAYSGGTYDTKPFIMMNYNKDVSSMYTLAHELGHSMHSKYTSENQEYTYSDYEIFVAEVASTVNEKLLTDYLLKQENKDLRIHGLNHQLENLRTTLFRQTMFAEFEKKIHEKIERNEPLTVTNLNEEFWELKSKYYSPVEEEELIKNEWMRIPHFYYNFYVYQYATGISAATQLATQIQSTDKGRSRYINFLKAGSSKSPVELLKDAGVDMTEKEPVEEAVKQYEEYLEELKKTVQ